MLVQKSIIKLLNLLAKGDQLGRKCWDLTENPSKIPILGFMKLSHEIILTVKWYITSLKLYTHVFETELCTTQLLYFAQKMGIFLVENGKVRLEIHLWFQTLTLWTFLVPTIDCEIS